MSKDDLKVQLSRLQQELGSSEPLDPETRRLLSSVSRDIERVLDDEHDDDASLVERVETAATDFEASHPRFARILREVTDTLAKLGL